MTIWEGALAIGVMLIVLGLFTQTQGDALARGEAERNAVVMGELHGGIEGYLKHNYARLERCFDGVAVEAGWEASSAGGEVRPWKVLRLYPVAGGYDHGAGGAQTLALAASAWGCDVAVPEWPDGVASLAGSGFLPSGLRGLRYDSAAEASNLYRGLDFRAAVRLVNLSRVANSPRLGFQSVLVAVKRSGEAMIERDAGWMASAAGTGDVGLLRSITVGTAVAERTIAGSGGAWSLEVCGSSGLTGLVLCTDPAVTAAAPLPVDRVELPGVAAEQQLTRYLFASGAAGTQRPSGVRAATDRTAARVVMVGSLSRDAFLSDVLFRVDIGIPEANLMETDIDMGGFGIVNVTYATGTDSDGDGLVDRGMQIVGPGATPATIGQASVAERAFPTRIHGDLHITGNLKIGCDDFEATQVTGRGRVWLCDDGRLQVGGAGFDGGLEAKSVYVEGDGRAQIGGPSYDTGLTPASLYLAQDGRAQVGGAAFDTGLEAKSVYLEGDGRAQVGGPSYDTGLMPASLYLAEDGRAQVGGASFDTGVTARSVYLEGLGRAQIGGGSFDTGLTPRSVYLVGTGANMGNIQAGGATFDMGGEQQSVFLATTAGGKVQLGGAAFDGSLTARSVFLRGNTASSGNIQAGGTSFALAGEQQSLFLRSGNGAKVQVGGTGFDAGLTRRSVFLHGAGTTMANLQAGGTSFELAAERQSAFLNSTVGGKLQVGVNPGDGFGAVDARSVWVQGSTQIGRAVAGFDAGVPDGGLLTGEQIRSSNGIRARGDEIVLVGGVGVRDQTWAALAPAADLDGDEVVAMRSVGGDVRITADDPVDTDDYVMIDSDDVWVEEDDRTNRRLRAALSTFVANELAFDADVAVTCLDGGVDVDHVSATGWYRDHFADTWTYRVTVTVNGISQTANLVVPVPYTGWSVSSSTGADDGIGGGGAGDTNYARIVYCDYE